MQRKISGEAGLELVYTAALCFAESNNLGLFYSKHSFNESYRTIILFQAALFPHRLMDISHWVSEVQEDSRWMDV